MNSSLEQTLIDVWRRVLIENATVVELGGKSYSVRITARKGLRQVDFVFDGNEIRGLEQNPDTKSRWAQLARAGKKVMQFLSEGRYVANVVDGDVTLYGKAEANG
jgi:precorrin-3B methylase